MITNSIQSAQARLFTASIAVKVIVLCLESLPKTKWIYWDAAEHSPEESSSFFSLGVYFWLNKLFLRGYRGVMDLDDLYPLDAGMAAEKLYARFSQKVRPVRYIKDPKFALLKDLCRTLAGPFLAPVAPRVALIAFKYCQPIFIDTMLRFLQSPEDPSTKSHGYGLIGACFLIYAGIAVSHAFYGYYTQKAMYMIRGCLGAAVFSKTTETKLTGTDDSAALTLMSTDVERILVGAHVAHELWANTIEVAIGCLLLEQKLGVAFVSPIVIIAICAVSMTWVLRNVGRRQSLWMAKIQNRVGLTANTISHMKLYKISGITGPVADLVQRLRVDEIKVGNSFRGLLITAALLGFTPIAISPVITFAFTSESLGVNTLFTSLSYIILLCSPLINMFQSLPQVFTAVTCSARIQSYLIAESHIDNRLRDDPEGFACGSEKDDPNFTEDQQAAFSIVNGSYGWGGEKMTLNNINTSIPAHRLTVVVGEVASGKSTFCKVLLGEVPVFSGRVTAHFPSSQIGYCEQTPFLYNATFKDNIIGHFPFDQKRYDEIIEATMLNTDARLLPQGHYTKIGSNGIMLSGGQKQRVSVARALYSEADVMIFDDILSGLDNDTEAELFRRVFGPGSLTRRRNVTVVICTHSVRHLPTADHIIALGDGGTVIEQGTFRDLMNSGKYVKSLGIRHNDSSTPSETDETENTDAVIATTPSFKADEAAVEDRTRQQGDWSIYTHYFSSVSTTSAIVLVICGILCGASHNLSTVWLRFWSENTFDKPTSFYVGIFALLRVGYLVFLLGNATSTVIFMTASAGTDLHKRAITTVVTAPLKFFTTTDSGIVTNLFSQDMTLLDNELPLALTNFTLDMFDTIGITCVIASATPYLAIGYPFLLVILYFVQKFYLRTSRQVRILDLEAKGPL